MLKGALLCLLIVKPRFLSYYSDLYINILVQPENSIVLLKQQATSPIDFIQLNHTGFMQVRSGGLGMCAWCYI